LINDITYQVLKNRRHEERSTDADTLRIVALLQLSVQTADWELERGE
jgi:hypothetical protein